MAKGVNYLPFMRREALTVPAVSVPADRVFTNIQNFATGGVLRAHLQDLIIFQGTDTSGGGSEATDGKLIRMRMAITGRNYLTEQLYDYKAFRDGLRPLNSVWNWKWPYRIFPGEEIETHVGQGPNSGVASAPTIRSIMFNGVRVVDDEPIMLYGQRDVTATDTNLWIASETLPVQIDIEVREENSHPLGDFAAPVQFYLFDHAMIGSGESALRGWVSPPD